MRGNYFQYHLHNTDAVETAAALHKEACETRLARIQNGADPLHKNGAHVVTLERGECSWRWVSTSGRKSPIFKRESTATSWRQTHPAWD